MDVTFSRIELVVRSVNKLSLSLVEQDSPALHAAAEAWSRMSVEERRVRALVSLLGRGMAVQERDLAWFTAPLSVEPYHVPGGTSGCVLEVTGIPATGRLTWSDEGFTWMGLHCRVIHDDMVQSVVTDFIDVISPEQHLVPQRLRAVPRDPRSTTGRGTQFSLRF